MYYYMFVQTYGIYIKSEPIGKLGTLSDCHVSVSAHQV